jgi:hypothetical protein
VILTTRVHKHGAISSGPTNGVPSVATKLILATDDFAVKETEGDGQPLYETTGGSLRHGCARDSLESPALKKVAKLPATTVTTKMAHTSRPIDNLAGRRQRVLHLRRNGQQLHGGEEGCMALLR